MKTRTFAMLVGGALLTSMTASAFAGVVVGIAVPAPVAVVPAAPVYAPPTVVVQNGYAAAVPAAVAPVVTVSPVPPPPMAVAVMPRRPVMYVVRVPRRVWLPGHWVGGVWVAGHWS
ncbi:hypothetical protein HDG34_004363 [Paraburkholderia sp. HC6.4b]|uniref:hypothetical protein n=1 Tax=unclassified Paraburkholderia TaxID=2615204 RepID=UPI00160A0A74|nr:MULTISPECIES: hypothetical protein [unclassified Paraburkholderia]MBB5410408.1 hypothetical protein [Paraburkholderia sp. HC6.4b]MBB5452790.1 hypothetical protein [Paraburkholderia sp. Kb1A]